MSDSLYEHPAFYDQLFGERRSDLPFYLGLADEAQGPLLELGAGTGRVTLALARAGCEVVALERSRAMLAVLASRLEAEDASVRDRVRLVEGDAGAIELGERFDLILCPFNGLAHHHGLEALAALLDAVTRHLGPRGRFAFDVLLPDPTLLRGDVAYVPWFRDPLTSEASRAEQRADYDALTQVLTLTTTVRSLEQEAAPVELTLRLRQLFPQETRLLLAHQGFTIERTAAELGDVIGYVCRRASPPA